MMRCRTLAGKRAPFTAWPRHRLPRVADWGYVSGHVPAGFTRVVVRGKTASGRIGIGEDDMTGLKNLILGFIAGAIATVTIHEIIKYYLNQHGYIPLEAWSMDPVAVTGLPKIASDMLWGGFWGSIFAFILGDRPTGSMTVKGALLGILGPAIIGVFLVRPLVSGAPIFFDGEPTLILSVLAILAGFGAVTAWLYGFFNSGCRLP